jgi:hypothetical protein
MGSISEASAVETRIGKLAADIDALSKDVANDPALQKQLYGVIMGAMAKVEAPMDTIWRMSTARSMYELNVRQTLTSYIYL